MINLYMSCASRGLTRPIHYILLTNYNMPLSCAFINIYFLHILSSYFPFLHLICNTSFFRIRLLYFFLFQSCCDIYFSVFSSFFFIIFIIFFCFFLILNLCSFDNKLSVEYLDSFYIYKEKQKKTKKIEKIIICHVP